VGKYKYVYGYEWTNFQFDLRKPTALIDSFYTTILQLHYRDQFKDYEKRFNDVHERNVLFEIGDSKQKGIPLIVIDLKGSLKLIKVKIQPVDVR
jgi:hypothetical protein